MGFNYAKEKAEFDRQWAEIRKQYEELGMSQDAIEKIHTFDWGWFKSQRRYISHLANLPGEVTMETIREASTETIPGDIPASLGSDPRKWLDEIEDEQLVRKLMQLSKDDIALLTHLVFEEYTQSEMAHKKAVNQATISRQFSQIQKIFRNRA